MRLVLSLAGIILLIVGLVYFLVPAGHLPFFLPGHQAGSEIVHTKHGSVATAIGVILLGYVMARHRGQL